MSRITIRDILLREAKRIGADGLVNVDLECGCGFDWPDFPPCSEQPHWTECVLAKKVIDKDGSEWFVPIESDEVSNES